MQKIQEFCRIFVMVGTQLNAGQSILLIDV